jgi:aspartate/methionine/tyrosine aminotransferase
VDYASYRLWRDETVARHPQVRRLDCMNPAKALASWVHDVQDPANDRSAATVQSAVRAWSNATGIIIPAPELVVARGVRDLLAATLATLRDPGSELWLPEDVYPAYWALARDAGFTPRPFATLGDLPWSFLQEARPRAAAILPLPLSPVGRWPSPSEHQSLVRWLESGDGHALVADAVYTYDFPTCRSVLDPLLATGRCAALWSCSKSWLTREALGIAHVPEAWAMSIRERASVPEATLGPVVALLQDQPGLPSRQARAFQRQWQRLAPSIRRAAPEWDPPTTGYFSEVHVNHERLLADHGILAVPASVFGAGTDAISVVSCLYDLASDERGAGPQ